MKFMFSESKEIYLKNKSKGCIEDNYVPKKSFNTTSKKIIVVNNKIRKLYSNCEECGELLIHNASKILGRCPSCDNQ